LIGGKSSNKSFFDAYERIEGSTAAKNRQPLFKCGLTGAFPQGFLKAPATVLERDLVPVQQSESG
jgi:hypothetical protein